MNTAAVYQAIYQFLTSAPISVDPQDVIPARGEITRPALPYLTLDVRAPLRVFVDSDHDSVSGGVAQRQQTGIRERVISIQGYGAGSEDWLMAAEQATRRDDVLRTFDAAGLVVQVEGSPRRVDALVDVAFEDRWTFELRARYRLTSSTEDLADVRTVVVSSTLEGAASDITITDTITP